MQLSSLLLLWHSLSSPERLIESDEKSVILNYSCIEDTHYFASIYDKDLLEMQGLQRNDICVIQTSIQSLPLDIFYIVTTQQNKF